MLANINKLSLHLYDVLTKEFLQYKTNLKEGTMIKINDIYYPCCKEHTDGVEPDYVVVYKYDADTDKTTLIKSRFTEIQHVKA